MTRTFASTMAVAAMLLCLGCEPQDRRPGLWLSGEERDFPADWAFTNDTPEIFVQVDTPYLLPHSVTVWCAEVDGTLYLAAFDPDSKNWPGWVRNNPDVRLKIGTDVYDVTLEEMADPEEIAPVQAAYVAKYQLDDPLPGAPGAIRYWTVTEP